MPVSAVGDTTTPALGAPKKDINVLSTEDFLKLLVTELTHQDPFEPMKNQELLNQVSSIREMEMNTQLNQTLQSLVLQGNLGAAANLIGKTITGQDAVGEIVTGLVTGVRVSDGKVLLELEGGAQVGVDKVTRVLGSPAGQIQTPATTPEA